MEEDKRNGFQFVIFVDNEQDGRVGASVWKQP